MKNKKLWIGVGIVVIIGIVILAVYKKNQILGNSAAIRIGVILPLTGSIAIDGEELLVGVKLAEKEINASSSEKVIFDVEDGQFDPKVSVSAYNKLNARHIDALIIAGDGPCEAVAPLINRDKIFTMAPLTGSLKVKDCSSWMFRCWFYVPYVAQYAAKFMKDEIVKNNFTVFYNDTLYGNLSCDSFQSEILSLGGNCGKESYPFLATSLRNEVAKIIQDNPDGIFITGFGLGFITAVNQVKETGYDGLLVTDNALADVMVLNGLKDSSDIYFVDLDLLKLSGNDIKRMNEFSQRYFKMTGKQKVSNQAILSYEATMSIVKNFSKNLDTMRSNILNPNKKLLPSTLDDIEFTSDGEAILPLVIKKYNSEGNPEIVKKPNVESREIE